MEMFRHGEFSVYQWFPNDEYEKVRDHVEAEEAMKAFKHYISSVGARLGTTTRVIITDGDDYTNMEWKFEEGITYPENLAGQYKRGIR